MKRIAGFFLAFNLCLFLAIANNLPQESSKKNKASSAKRGVVKYGTASYYSKKFHGRRTSDGSIYSSIKLSAACNVLPLGTKVKVTNLRNKKSVVVTINDRLHRKNKRLIDLSKYAAQKLDYVSRGITKVKIEVLSP